MKAKKIVRVQTRRQPVENGKSSKRPKVVCSLRRIREYQGIRLYELARLVGIDDSILGQFELYPDRITPNLTWALKIAHFLGVTVEDIWQLREGT